MPVQRRAYTEQFKSHIRILFNNGISRTALIKEHNIKESTLDSWLQNFKKDNSLAHKENETIRVLKLKVANLEALNRELEKIILSEK